MFIWPSSSVLLGFATPYTLSIPAQRSRRHVLSMTVTTTEPTPSRRATRPAKLGSVVDADSCFTTICGVTVHHKRWSGEGEDTPELLCVHGFGASLLSFEPCVGRLRRSVSSIQAFDVPGFGRTQRPTVTELWRYSPAFAGVVANELVPGRRILVGHSMGALVAVEAAVARPPEALILIAPALKTARRAPPEFVRRAFAVVSVLMSLVVAPLVMFFLRRFVIREAFWRRGLSFARGDPSLPVPDELVDAYMRPLGWPGWDVGLLNFARAMALYQAVAGHNAWRRLKTLVDNGTPVLIIHGDADRVVPLTNSQALVRCIPRLQLATVNGVGHCPQEETPDVFADVVERFLSGLQPNNRTSRVSVPAQNARTPAPRVGDEPVVT